MSVLPNKATDQDRHWTQVSGSSILYKLVVSAYTLSLHVINDGRSSMESSVRCFFQFFMQEVRTSEYLIVYVKLNTEGGDVSRLK